MFKKNLYSFCALIALTCGAYAMEDDLSSSEEKKDGRNALRASTASLGIDDQEPAETSQSSPASSTQDSLFSNDEGKVTFTWEALMAAVERGESRAINLHGFLMEKYWSDRDQIKWGEKPFYKMPFLQKQLDDV